MGENSGNHGRVFDCGDDLEGAAAVGAAFDVDVEHPFEQPRPTHTRLRSLRVRVIARVSGRRLGRARNDLGAQRSVGCEHAMKANQMVAWTRDQRARRGGGALSCRRAVACIPAPT